MSGDKQPRLDIVIGTDETDDLFLSYLLFLVGCLACLVIPFVNYLGIELMSDLEILPKQLETFRIQDAGPNSWLFGSRMPLIQCTATCVKVVMSLA